jgi:hypothetical protein
MFLEKGMRVELGGQPHKHQEQSTQPLVAKENPSWKETAETLPLYPRIAAETSYASKVIPRIVADGENQVGWKRNSSSYWREETQGKTDNEVVSSHIAGVLDAFNYDPKEADFEGNYYHGRLHKIETDDLLAQKDKIFADATQWDPAEQRQEFGKAVKAARKKLRPYDPNLLEYYLEKVGQLPEEQVNKVSLAEKRLRRKSVQTLAINTSLVAASYFAGKASVDHSVIDSLSGLFEKAGDVGAVGPAMNFVGEKLQEPEVIAGIGSATFAGYYGTVALNGRENNELLKMKGISTVSLSKAGFDMAPNRYKSLAGYAGYYTWQGISEVPIAIGAVAAAQDKGLKGFGDYGIGANVVSTGLWLGIYKGTNWYRNRTEADGLEQLLRPKKEWTLFHGKKEGSVEATEATGVTIDDSEMSRRRIPKVWPGRGETKKGDQIVEFPSDNPRALDRQEVYGSSLPDMHLVRRDVVEATE